MRIYTAHLCPGAPPLLVREGFSFGCALFGPLWLLLHRAWVPFVLVLVAGIAAGSAPGPFAPLLWLGEAWLLGLFGRDLYRWSLARRGYMLAQVIAARDADAALARLLAARPDLVSTLAP